MTRRTAAGSWKAFKRTSTRISDVKPIPLKAIKVALVALAVGLAAALGLFTCEFVGENVERICGTITGHVSLHAIMGF